MSAFPALFLASPIPREARPAAPWTCCNFPPSITVAPSPKACARPNAAPCCANSSPSSAASSDDSLTQRDQRHLFIILVARNPLRPRVQRRLCVHHELIMMMSMAEDDLHRPGAIDLTFHWQRLGMPIIKVAHQRHLFGLRGDADEVHRLDCFPGRSPVDRPQMRM